MKNIMQIDIKVLDKRLLEVMPAYATNGSAGFDLRACSISGYGIELGPGEQEMIGTGIAMHIKDPGYAAMIFPRSGLGSKGLVLGNLVGLIDSDYQGEIKICAWNRSSEPIQIESMERIAQLVFINVYQAHFEIVNEFIESDRGDKGFGSTGVS